MLDRSPARRRGLFSSRTAWDTAVSAWARLLLEKRQRGENLHDLTIANPTACEFDYDPDLLKPLSNPGGSEYVAESQGLITARAAVQRYYQDHQQELATAELLDLDLSQIFLTTSTSEAYSFLFRLLCDPGDEILIAQPSYPLFDFLATLDDVRLVPYPLFYDYGWHIDFHSLRERITERTRAIVLVHPNNPTGHFTDRPSRRALEQLCAKEDIALIVDEVFLDYSFPEKQSSFVLGEHPALTFVMSGLSKVAGLPQMKLSWICAFGPAHVLEDAHSRLEIIADTFLSVSTPIQLALPDWLRDRRPIQQQISKRVKENLLELDKTLRAFPAIQRLSIEGGWSAILRLPAIGTGVETSVALLEHANVVVHPGVFFGLAEAGWIVISLLPPAARFSEAIHELARVATSSMR